MITLGCTNIGDDDNFPPLSKADTTIKHLEKPYQLGDGKQLGGPLFTARVSRRVVIPNEPGIDILLPVLCVCANTWYRTPISAAPGSKRERQTQVYMCK
jgi:hypothetical protein